MAAGEVLWLDRHIARLCRDTRALGLPELAPERARDTLRHEARRAFGAGDGILRLELLTLPDGALELRAAARPLGAEPPLWSACCSRERHPGASPTVCGVKRAHDPVIEAARAEARARGVDEVLLLDREDRVVEGARSCLVWVMSDGVARFPEPELGGVASLACERARERAPSLRGGTLHRERLHELRELIAINAVRGARPVVRLDGAPIGSGTPGPWARRLAAALGTD